MRGRFPDELRPPGTSEILYTCFSTAKQALIQLVKLAVYGILHDGLTPLGAFFSEGSFKKAIRALEVRVRAKHSHLVSLYNSGGFL